jgi:mono/diheme cytochrome c family protein
VRRLPRLTLVPALLVLAAAGPGCGSEGIEAEGRGAQLFAERCGGCHTLKAAGTQGSTGERVTGPNLDYRRETRASVLFAIRNGGFSGAIMPQNIVVGEEAEEVAEFVARYAGIEAKSPPSPKPANGPGAGQSGAPQE